MKTIYDSFKAKYPKNDIFHTGVIEMVGLLGDAAAKAGSVDPKRVAFALEGLKTQGAFGEVEMRAGDHQLLAPLFIQTFAPVDGRRSSMASKGLKLGFKTDATIPPRDTAPVQTCQMKRPAPEPRSGPARPMELLATSLLNGLTYGFLLFMLAAGLTLVFSLMGVMNFAHASLYMLGAYVGRHAGRAAGLRGGAAAGAAAGGPGRLRAGALAAAPAARAWPRGRAAVHLRPGLPDRGGGQAGVGCRQIDHRFPPALEGSLFNAFGTPYPVYKGFMVLVAVASLAGLYALVAHTRVGLVVRAALTHPLMVQNLGHDTDRVFMAVFGLGSALAALAGVMGGAALTTEPSMAAQLGTIVFVVVVIGGLGSIRVPSWRRWAWACCRRC
jgi:branched-chain amino acid transport system permease protein